MKFSTSQSKQSFFFRGIFIIVSNITKSDLISNAGDIGCTQRFVQVAFDTIRESINWALHMDSHVIQVPTGVIHLDNDCFIFAVFYTSCATVDQNAFTSNHTLKEGFLDYLSESGCVKLEIKTHNSHQKSKNQ